MKSSLDIKKKILSKCWCLLFFKKVAGIIDGTYMDICIKKMEDQFCFKKSN
jgi:hypothetical protein